MSFLERGPYSRASVGVLGSWYRFEPFLIIAQADVATNRDELKSEIQN